MQITLVEYLETTYRPMFAPADLALSVMTFDVEGATLTFSHREDDPMGAWFCDAYIQANGMPVFVHGQGDRSCAKREAQGPLWDAIMTNL